MIAYIVVEGRVDIELLRSVLDQEVIEGVNLVSGGELSSTKSLARSFLIARQKPVALVFDAQATAPDVLRERFQAARENLGMFAGGVPYRIVMAIPTLDELFSTDANDATLARRASFLDDLNGFLRAAHESTNLAGTFAG